MISRSRTYEILDNGCLVIDSILEHPHMAYQIDPWTSQLKTYIIRKWASRNRFKPVGSLVLFRLIPAHFKQGVHPALDTFLATFPPGVVEHSADYAYGQMNILRLCAASQISCELLFLNPKLLWMYSITSFTNWVKTGVLALDNPQHTILGNILYREVKPVEAKVLKRIHIVGGSYHELSLIFEFHRNQLALNKKQLTHLKTIPLTLIKEMIDQSQFTFSPYILSLLSKDQGGQPTLDKLDEALAHHRGSMRLTFSPYGTKNALSKAVSLTQLARIHDRLLQRFLEVNPIYTGFDFPDPPLPGTSLIKPITTAAALVEEGINLRHCVGSMAPAVKLVGNIVPCFFYHVAVEQPVTLRIEFDHESHEYKIAELRGSHNQAPGENALEVVKTWLRRAQGKALPHNNSTLRINP